MNYPIQSYDIYNAIKELDDETNNHNATLDIANKIFDDVEKGLNKINIDYWYPSSLFPRIPELISSIPFYAPLQPFTTTHYQIGYISKKLVIRKITSEYDYVRDSYGNVIYSPSTNTPYTNKLKDELGEQVPVADSSREIRVMVIEYLPGFIEYIRSNIAIHTQTLNSALGNISRI